MAAQPDRAGRLLARGMGNITDQVGVRLLDALVRSDRIRTAVLPGADFHTWCSFYPASATGMLESLLHAQPSATAQASEEPGSRAAILAVAPAERLALLEAYMMDLVRRVLRIPASKTLAPELPLNRFGVDSLMAIELKNRIESDLGIGVQVSRILLSESLHKLAAELLELLPHEARAAQSTTAPTRSPATPAPTAVAAKGGGLGRVLETIGELDSEDAELLTDDYFAVNAGE
jgi:acyl carrier protein